MSVMIARSTWPQNHGPYPRRWTREEYHRAANMGLFRPGERLELIRGEIIEKVTQNRPHAVSVIKIAQTLEDIFGPGFMVQQQLPLALAEDGEPEPDVLVVPGAPDDYRDHPTQTDVVLLVEVSNNIVEFDRGTKAALYAEAGIADYWIVNLGERRLEVRRDPIAVPDAPFGFAYRTVVGFDEQEAVAPLAAADKSVRVAELLPAR